MILPGKILFRTLQQYNQNSSDKTALLGLKSGHNLTRPYPSILNTNYHTSAALLY